MTTATAAKAMPAVRRVQIGSVLVDSGMVMVVDPCRARERENHVDEKTGLQHGPGKVDYETATDVCYNGPREFVRNGKTEVFDTAEELTPEQHRQIGYGAVCTTGRGDGEYPVYALYVGNTLVGMEVLFQ